MAYFIFLADGGPPNVAGPGGANPLTLPSRRAWTRESLSSSCSQVVLVYLPPFLRNMPTLFVYLEAENIQNTKKTLFGGFKVIQVH